jgi:hypothetical protein
MLMSVLNLVRRIRALKVLVAVAALVAAALAILISYEVRFSPPGLAQRESSYWLASTQMLVDSKRSAIGDARTQLDLLATRAPVYAGLAAKPAVAVPAARAAGVPPGSYVITSAQTGRDGRFAGAQDVAAPEPPSPAVILSTNSTPIIQMTAQAPTEALAQRLAEATANALQTYVREFGANQGLPLEDRVALRKLNPPRSEAIERGITPVQPVLLGLGLWGVLVALLVAVDALIRQARRERTTVQPQTTAA